MIKAPLSEIMEKESLSENGQKNIQLAMQSTENLAELANNLINFQKEELYSPQTIVTAHELNHYLSNYMHQFDSLPVKRTSHFPTKVRSTVWMCGLIQARWIPFCETCFLMP